MNIDELTVGQIKEISRLIGAGSTESNTPHPFVGKYVIVRCRDAGVHAGILREAHGRSCILDNSRRLWYWKPLNGGKYLSGVAVHGLDSSSKVGAPIEVCLTENCEIIVCSDAARKSIVKAETDENKS